MTGTTGLTMRFRVDGRQVGAELGALGGRLGGAGALAGARMQQLAHGFAGRSGIQDVRVVTYADGSQHVVSRRLGGWA